jgi:Cu-Zn family superoxide dismutase
MLDQSILLMYHTMQDPPEACAHITGSSEIHNLTGDVYVYPFLEGSLLVADVEGIPFSGFYGFHIHQHGPCITGEGYTGFHNVGGHFTTVENAPHPYHAGDLPVLMAYLGHAYMIVYTDRFKPKDILGRAIIIHEWPDDYRTQPTGDAGQHIGCGTVYPCVGVFGGQPVFQPSAPPVKPPVTTPAPSPQPATPAAPAVT